MADDEKDPIARLREALDTFTRIARDVSHVTQVVRAIDVLAQLETEREADKGRIAELVTALEDNGCELVRCGRRIRELESQLAALRAPLNRRHPDEAPIDGLTDLLFCHRGDDGESRPAFGCRAENGWDDRQSTQWVKHDRVRWWVPASELLTDEPVSLRAPETAPVAGELAGSIDIVRLHAAEADLQDAPELAEQLRTVCAAAEKGSALQPLTGVMVQFAQDGVCMFCTQSKSGKHDAECCLLVSGLLDAPALPPTEESDDAE